MSAPLRIIAAVLGSEESAALEAAGYVCAPRAPTQRMIEAAYWSASAENAAGVWEDNDRGATRLALETRQSGAEPRRDVCDTLSTYPL